MSTPPRPSLWTRLSGSRSVSGSAPTSPSRGSSSRLGSVSSSSFRGGRRPQAKGSESSRSSSPEDGSPTLVPPSPVEDSFDDLPTAYFEADSDPFVLEVRSLRPDFSAEDLDALAELRTQSLEGVSSALAARVQSEYAALVRGAGHVSAVEREVVAAWREAKAARAALSKAGARVDATLSIARQTRAAEALRRRLRVLRRLRRVHGALAAARAALEEGFWAGALAHARRGLNALSKLDPGVALGPRLAAGLAASEGEVGPRAQGALKALATRYSAAEYGRTQQALFLLGGGEAAAAALPAAFLAALSSALTRSVRGVLLARPGLQERARSAGALPELVRLVPPDLFRSCLARALELLFDFCAAHRAAVRWTDAALRRAARRRGALAKGGQEVDATVTVKGAGKGGGAENGPLDNGAFDGSWDTPNPEAPPSDDEEELADRLAALDADAATAREAPLGPAALALGPHPPPEALLVAVRADEEAWAAFLRLGRAALLGSRQLVWEEAARRLAALLSAPAAVQGEHFLRVLAWTRRAARLGEAFSGVACETLRGVLARAGDASFRAFHAAKLDSLDALLQIESWHPLPEPAPLLVLPRGRRTGAGGAARGAGLASDSFGESSAADEDWTGHQRAGRVEGRLRGGGDESSGEDDAGEACSDDDASRSFDDFLALGNPWRVRLPGSGRDGAGLGQDAALATEPCPMPGLPTAPDPNPAPEPHTATTRSPSSDTEEQLAGDFIDENSQKAVRRPLPSTEHPPPAPGGADATATAASWRMLAWQREYVVLAADLPAAAPLVLQSMGEHVELYMLHVLAAFAPGALGDLAGAEGDAGALRRVGEGWGLSLESAALLAHALARGVGRRVMQRHADAGRGSQHGGLPGKTPGGALPGSQAAGTTWAAGGAPPLAAALPNPPASDSRLYQALAHPQQDSALSHAGNLHGLAQRWAASESLRTAAGRQRAAQAVSAALLGDAAAKRAAADAALAQKTADAVGDAALRAGVERLGALDWLGEVVAGGGAAEKSTGGAPVVKEAEKSGHARVRASTAPPAPRYLSEEPPTSHAPWVDELERRAARVWQQLAAAPLPARARARVWGMVLERAEEALVRGVASLPACTLVGRAALSLDVAGAARALQRAGAAVEELPAAAGELRRASELVRAFYLPLSDLGHWAAQHPGYSEAHLAQLAGCMADSQGLGKQDRALALARVEAEVRLARAGALLPEPGGGGGVARPLSETASS